MVIRRSLVSMETTRGNGVAHTASGGRKAVGKLYATLLGRLAVGVNGAQQCAAARCQIEQSRHGASGLGGPNGGGGERGAPVKNR
jgi:hypothetical protein